MKYKNNLSAILADKGLNKTTLHKKSGISRSTLYRISDNKNKGINYETLHALCDELNVTSDVLLGREPYVTNSHTKEEE